MARQVKSIPKKVCENCQRSLAYSNFYSSNSRFQSDGKFPFCKACVKTMIGDCTDLSKIYEVLQTCDRPFIKSIWDENYEICVKNNKDIFGSYLRRLCISKYKDSLWKDSVFDDELEKNRIAEEEKTIGIANTNEAKTKMQELQDKWGVGYTKKEYLAFEQKWMKLVDNYGNKSAIHEENLKTYIRFRVKEEFATASNDIDGAKAWGTLAKDAQKDAKITVNQLKGSELNGGIELIPQLFEAVESKMPCGLIPILPKMRKIPYDDADLIIWAVIGYLQRLEGNPMPKYEDIWKFYDEMLLDFFEQKGYTPEQIEQERAERNAVFRDLGEVYKEPLYEEE